MTPEEAKLLAAKQRVSPVMDTPKLNKLKRKRAESDGSESGRNGKMRVDRGPQVVIPRMNSASDGPMPIAVNSGPGAASVISLLHSKPDHSLHNSADGLSVHRTEPSMEPQSPAREKTSLQPVQAPMAASRARSTDRRYSEREMKQIHQTIEAQLGLEILMKHNELRLIDQEIAKSQVALEQLRRCHEIPYPASNVSATVSHGVGPLRQAQNTPTIASPAPWGVSDGPYTRHYARWLIPDQRFDGEVEAPMEQRAMAGKLPSKGRGLRGGQIEYAAGVTTSRGHRGSTASKLQSLSSGYPQARDKAGPMIRKRKSDGQVVKLVCLDCRRDNFSSAQGFINHCRIAHSRNFASHDAAADACGEPVETDEAGALLGGNNEPPSAATAGIVHPLIRSAHLIKPPSTCAAQTSSTDAEPQKPGSEAAMSVSAKDRPVRKMRVASSPHPSFVPSSDIPNLSALMQDRGFGLDLQHLLTDTRSHIDVMDISSEDDSHSEAEDVSGLNADATSVNLTVRGGLLTARQPARATMSPAPLERTSSRKGLEKPKQNPSRFLEPVNVPESQTRGSPYETPGLGPRESSPPNLSPDTVESNQAPSLVSDDGDYEVHSESESSPSSAAGDDEGGDFTVEVEDYESAAPTGTATDADMADSPKQPSHPVRRASAFRRSIGDREEKHVSFVSPSPAPTELPSPKKGTGRRKSKG